MSKKIKTKSKEEVKEATDIILNTEDDDSAVVFLRETLQDDFPDLELGSMDLHEATKVLGGDKESSKNTAIKNLNQAFSDFMSKKNNPKAGVSKKEGSKRKRRRKK